MGSKNYTVGKDVLAYCSKCKLTLSHIIMALKDPNTIAKVQCNTCKSIHAFKEDPGIKKTVSGKAPKGTRGRKAKDNKPGVSINEMWVEAMNNTKNKSKEYSTKTRFIIGDVVDHPKFGPGVVEEILDNTKIKVIFRNEIKVLVHNIAA